MSIFDLARFEAVRQRYGDVASWAAWAPQSDPAKATSGVSDLSIFDIDRNPEILSVVHGRQVLVGLNASRDPGAERWCNFHSPLGKAKDFKLRYALRDTPLWGAYMTDLIKGHFEVDSSKAVKSFKSDAAELARHAAVLEDEIALVTEEKPVLIAMGGDAFKLLKRTLGRRYEIARIRHYSDYTVNKEAYRKEIGSWIEEVGLGCIKTQTVATMLGEWSRWEFDNYEA